MKGTSLLAASVLIPLLTGCAEPEFKMIETVWNVDPLPVGTVSSLSPSDQSIYYIDYTTGHVMRVSLDGEVRETVVECGKGDMIGLDWDWDGKAQSWLHLRSVPGRKGHVVLDVSGARTVVHPDHLVTSAQDAYLVNSDVKTKWSFTFDFSPFEIEPGHHHDYIEDVTFTDGSTVKTYDYVVEAENFAGFYGMADDDHAVLLDMPNVIVWNLATDEKTCIANIDRDAVWSAVVWPRDLHDDQRFTPVVKTSDRGAVYEWEMSDPSDFRKKPEYIKRKLVP